MASKNPRLDLDIYTQLNTSLSSFDGFTQLDINNHPNADMDLDVHRQLNDSITSFEGFTQSDLTNNNDNLDNETLSNLSSDGEVQIDTSDEIDNCESSSESNFDKNNIILGQMKQIPKILLVLLMMVLWNMMLEKTALLIGVIQIVMVLNLTLILILIQVMGRMLILMIGE